MISIVNEKTLINLYSSLNFRRDKEILKITEEKHQKKKGIGITSLQ